MEDKHQHIGIQVFDIVQREVEKHGQLPTACRVALAKLIKDNLFIPFFEQHGASLLNYFWRENNRRRRHQAIEPTVASKTSGRHAKVKTALTAAKVVSLSIFDLRWRVPGQGYKPLGLLVKADCLAIAEGYVGLATENGSRAAAFNALASKLSGQRTVQTVFKTEAAVRAVLSSGVFVALEAA